MFWYGAEAPKSVEAASETELGVRKTIAILGYLYSYLSTTYTFTFYSQAEHSAHKLCRHGKTLS